MDEELKERMDEITRLTEEIKEEGKKAELARIRYAHFQVYAAGQHDAWHALLAVISRLKGASTKEEADAEPNDPD